MSRSGSSQLRWSVRSAGALVLTLLILTAGCTTTHREADSSSKLPTGTIDTTEPGFDPAVQLAEANGVRDELVRGGIDCQGEAEPPDLAPGDIKFGVVAQLFCSVDGAQVQIAVYRTPAAKRSGISRTTWLACTSKIELRYVDGPTWLVGAMRDGTSESDPVMIERVAAALDAPVETAVC